MTGRTLQAEVDTFLDLVEQGEVRRAVAGVLALFDSGLSCSDIVREVLAPVQLEVGTRWVTGQWTVADEHHATAAVDDVLGALSARLDPPGPHTIALCSAEGEWHVTPLRMGALVLREQGWQVRLLGASTPADQVRATLGHLGADVVAIHCAMPTTLPGVPPVVVAAHDAGLAALAAGRGFGSDDSRALRLGCDGWAPDVLAGARLASSWLDAPPSVRVRVPSPHRVELDAVARLRRTLVEDACDLLAGGPATAAGGGQLPRAAVRDDLHLLLDATVSALLVDDPQVLEDFVGWLQVVLVRRGVPASVVDRELEALAEGAGAELPSLSALLGRQVRHR